MEGWYAKLLECSFSATNVERPLFIFDLQETTFRYCHKMWYEYSDFASVIQPWDRWRKPYLSIMWFWRRHVVVAIWHLWWDMYVRRVIFLFLVVVIDIT